MNSCETRNRTPPPSILAWGFLVCAMLLAGCEKNRNEKEHGPQILTREAVSVVDGMILLDYPGPKGQALKKDGTPDYFCDVPGLINALLDPEQAHQYTKAYVQPFDGREWGSYPDNWIEVSKPVYVFGSSRMGAMGPTLVPFLETETARKFIGKNGGRILEFSNLTLDAMAEHAHFARKMLDEGGMKSKMAGHGKDPQPKTER